MPKQTIKPFLSYQEQIENLELKKNLIIKNPAYATMKLVNIGYYALVDGYKDLFYDAVKRQYLQGVTFEDIVALYEFDENLRELIFKYIGHIEQKIRSLVSYHFCDTFSEKQSDYLNPTNYNYIKKNQNGIDRLIKILLMEANYNMNHLRVIYQRTTYGNVPLWVIVSTLTFGQISKMYSFLQPSIQSKISHQFVSVNEKELTQYLKVLTDFRNICAHNERLFLFHCRTDIPDTALHKKFKIAKIGSQYKKGKNDVFAVTIAFYYLLSKDEFKHFKKGLHNILNIFENQSSSTYIITLLDTMGFPDTWKNDTI